MSTLIYSYAFNHFQSYLLRLHPCAARLVRPGLCRRPSDDSQKLLGATFRLLRGVQTAEGCPRPAVPSRMNALREEFQMRCPKPHSQASHVRRSSLQIARPLRVDRVFIFRAESSERSLKYSCSFEDTLAPPHGPFEKHLGHTLAVTCCRANNLVTPTGPYRSLPHKPCFGTS